MGYGSLINMVMDKSRPVTPEAGMGATKLGYSDRKPYTVTKVSPSGKTLWATEDLAVRTDNNGQSESQSYTFATDPNGYPECYTLRSNGKWVRKGDTQNGSTLMIGSRSKYHDPSF